MKLSDTAMLAMNALRHRNLRSWLAILGIVIGVAAIVSLISISVGMSQQISSRLSTLGANVITISSGGQGAQRGGIPGMGPMEMRQGELPGMFRQASSGITFQEADTLRQTEGLKALDARVSGRAEVSYIDKNSSLQVVGSEPSAFLDTVGVALLSGQGLNSNDQYTAVIGYGVANATFNDLDMVNKQIRIKGTAFRVVGILNQTKAVSQIVAVTADGYDTDAVAASLEETLLILHHVDSTSKDFTIQTAATMTAAISSITSALALFLGGIASISLLVGGIGVANTMFMSVLEQTKYIGILKAIGAKSSDVLKLFLVEAGIIGLVGGALGVVLSLIVSFVLVDLGIPSAITPELAGLGLAFSVGVGLVSGVIPARNAASLEPIDALRYE